MGKASQHVPVLKAVPFEENLFLPEYAAYAIYRYSAMAQDVKVIIPELILYEKSLHRAHSAKKTQCICRRIYGQIAHDIGTIIILSHLISRWREER